MKKKVKYPFIALILLIGIGVPVLILSCKGHDTKAVSSQKEMYHCPMHPNYISEKAGDCPICGMKLVRINKDQHSQALDAKGEKRLKYYRDASKPWITSDKPGKASDGMDLVPVYEDENEKDGTGIKIDPTTIQNMGVTTLPVGIKILKREIRTSATLENNETGVFVVNAKIMGYVEKLFVDFTGQSVKKGQPLLSMYSPDLVSTQEEYLQALHYAKGLSGGSQIARDGALELVESAKRRLLNWDISEAQIEELSKRGTPQKSMTIFSPVSGVVLEKMVVTGQNIDAGIPLYKIVDLSNIWAMANVYQEDLPYVKTGMIADVELSSIPGKVFQGKVQFISPVLDMNSKTAQVRIVIPNTADYALKPQMFASVKLVSTISEAGIAIPEQAIIHSGTRNIVIIALGNGYFRPQEIEIGTRAEGFVQVLAGLKEGQVIVTSSQFLIDSESNLRAAINKMARPDSAKGSGQQPPMKDHEDHNMPGMSMEDKTAENVVSAAASMNDLKMNLSNHKSKRSNKHLIDNKETAATGAALKGEVFICPMDKDVISDKPGKCPKCGMNLVRRSN